MLFHWLCDKYEHPTAKYGCWARGSPCISQLGALLDSWALFRRLSRVKQTLRFPGLPSAVLLRATHAPQVGFTLAACQGQAERRHTHTHTLTPLLNHTTLALHTVSIQLVVMVSSETRFLQSWSSLSIYSRVIVYCRWTHMHEHRPLCLISALCGCMCVHMLPLCPTFCFVCQDVCVGVKV